MTQTVDKIKGMTKTEENKFYDDWLVEIRNFSKTFLKDAYDFDLNIPVELNGRLKRALGRFRYRYNHSLNIEIAKDLIRYYDEETIYGTVKHELIHYVLFAKGLPYRDGQRYFENELIKHGSHSTNTVQLRGKVNYQVYACTKCHTKYYRKRKIDEFSLQFSRCGKCKSDIEYMGKEEKLY